ncbi:MAG TPA: MarC family protein [Myxococcaceae bacterium]|nr:MarC family protein [Myxococcaceae bacterium]
MNAAELASSFAVALSAIFFVVDPFGVVPISLVITAGASAQKMRSMALRACSVACGLLIFFALFGGFLFTEEGLAKDDVALVPLAIPLLAGPGAIASSMVLMSRGHGATYVAVVLSSIVLTFVASYLVLRSARHVQRVLQQSGIAILHRVTGLILAAIAVQFMADGLKDLLSLH